MAEVDPDVWQYLGELGDGPTPALHSLSVEGAREMMTELYEDDAGESVARVDELLVPGYEDQTRLRVYTPDGETPFPAVVFFHGGGWALGSLDTHDSLCRALSNRAECVVVSVDYSLAPEHPFPVPLEDAYLATEWVTDNASAIDVDPDRVAVAGDSAGGNLTAAVALLARDRGGPALVHQALAYPVLDHALESESYDDNPGIMFSKADMAWLWSLYLRSDIDGRHPYAAPLAAPDLSGLPPATVLTGDVDLLRDDGRRCANRLADAGVTVRHENYDGMVHAFLQFEGVETAERALDDLARTLRDAFSA
jgi:acetyl esterase